MVYHSNKIKQLTKSMFKNYGVYSPKALIKCPFLYIPWSVVYFSNSYKYLWHKNDFFAHMQKEWAWQRIVKLISLNSAL